MICGLLFQTLRNIEERITGDFVLNNIWSGKQTKERVSVSGNLYLFLAIMFLSPLCGYNGFGKCVIMGLELNLTPFQRFMTCRFVKSENPNDLFSPKQILLERIAAYPASNLSHEIELH